MFLIIVSTFIVGLTSASYSNEFHFSKLRLEKHNKLNKGIWHRNSVNGDAIEKTRLGDFIFSPDYQDVENELQGNRFFESINEDGPSVAFYVNRTRRSTEDGRHSLTTNIKTLNKKSDTSLKDTVENKSPFMKSELISKLKPVSLINEFPYEIALLLDNERNSDRYNYVANVDKSSNRGKVNKNFLKTQIDNKTEQIINSLIKDKTKILKEFMIPSANTNESATKHNYNAYETDIIKKLEYIENSNNTDNNLIPNKVNRDVSDEAKVWTYKTPTDPNAYVTPVIDNNKSKGMKAITEKSLLKILATLTKTFRKIVRHHDNIKEIHKKLQHVNEVIDRNVAVMSKKFVEFNTKYENLVLIIEKLKSWEAKLISKDEYFCNKEKEIAEKLKQFEEQQNKFVAHQKQFYNVQKFMLDQSEKINARQNVIAKTQSEISHRQNNFGRILKKVKQLLNEKRNRTYDVVKPDEKANDTNDNELSKIVNKYTAQMTTTNTPITQTTEQVKINLFSIPHSTPLENKDEYILKEKDEQSVDDLVYKYYFNNTFIENFMRNQILADFVANPENTVATRNIKNKREQTTKLLPVKKGKVGEIHRRERRWIRHPKKKIWKSVNVFQALNKDEKIVLNAKVKEFPREPVTETDNEVHSYDPNNPFLTMATNFCNEIGQNINPQILSWCIEKSLRRLGHIDFKAPATPSPQKFYENRKDTPPSRIAINDNEVEHGISTLTFSKDGTTFVSEITKSLPTEPSTTVVEPKETPPDVALLFGTTDVGNLYFPDNDELESNLKNFEMKNDPEGTFYYDGSLHASDMALDDSGGFSDIVIPDLDSNSRIEIDPTALDLQIKRHTFLQKQRFKGNGVGKRKA